MLATFVIFLREDVEASMIVAILLAYLNLMGRRGHFRHIFLGSAGRCCWPAHLPLEAYMRAGPLWTTALLAPTRLLGACIPARTQPQPQPDALQSQPRGRGHLPGAAA